MRTLRDARALIAFVLDEPAAASLRATATHYHGARRPLSLADCICLAAARRGDRVATADGPMLETAEIEGIATVPLASSRR